MRRNGLRRDVVANMLAKVQTVSTFWVWCVLAMALLHTFKGPGLVLWTSGESDITSVRCYMVLEG